MEEIIIDTEFIKLDSLLKYAAVVQTGADAKFFISEGLVLVEGEVETRRGRKIYDGMTVKVLADDEEVNLIIKKR
ncbi:RNA-binding S4 domain-containing protein [Parvimonas sp. G1641]|uniref:RNA-binding S4 domain-containing protein n=1 Tax=Parvimonas sp. G1641 TaxID=3388846 RepID=UPI003980A7AF